MNSMFSMQGYSMTNQLVCVVEGEDIYQIEYPTMNKKPIGKTAAAYNELEQTTTEYYNKLVELGVIQKPKDPQEAMAEMQKTMQSMASLIQSLSDEVKELKQNGHERDSDSSGEDVPQRGRKQRGTASAASDSGNA